MSQNKAFSTPFILAVLCIYFSYFLHGISVITLAQNMTSLAEKFSTDNAGIAYLISGIGLGRLISILFFGVISDKFGRRAVILMAVIMYLLFFFGIPACPNLTLAYGLAVCVGIAKEGANKQVISSQADSLIKISRIWADFFPVNTSNQPI
ncbi:amino acid/amine transport protein [Shigella sonnei]|nr:amino acid/amine transport protein [Shigella sonnei]